VRDRTVKVPPKDKFFVVFAFMLKDGFGLGVPKVIVIVPPPPVLERVTEEGLVIEYMVLFLVFALKRNIAWVSTELFNNITLPVEVPTPVTETTTVPPDPVDTKVPKLRF
jgi:hypothetical protein